MNPNDTIKKLLMAGVVAGPLFVAVALAQALTRGGFDMVRHPASLLSLGELGWIQIGNFVLTGLLFLAMAVGVKRVLTSGVGRTWVPILLAIFALGMIGGGVFLADPALGFPPGAPEGALPPSQWSWHSTIHAFMPIIAFNALIIAFFILARRFASSKQRGWMASSISIGLTTLVLTALPGLTGNPETGAFNFIPLWIGLILGLGYASLIAGKFRAELEPRELSSAGVLN